MTSECPVVAMPLGKVKGRACVKPKKAEAKQVYRYAKIPFAKPPLDELRFKPPQPADPWEGVLDGTVCGPIPVQPLEMMAEIDGFMAMPDEFEENYTEMSEDCLHLQVYTSNPNPSAKLPVLLWIFGGGLQVGMAKSYDGNVLAALHDCVVVVPNYRISVFGFLSISGDDSPCKGNMGLLDQTMAMEWVQKNVSAFGGDPDNVTIFGESAGAISVGLHVHSPRSKGLFHRAISHSGVGDFPMMARESNDDATRKIMKGLGINDEDLKVGFEKLSKTPRDEIMKVAAKAALEFAFFCALNSNNEMFPEHFDEVVAKKNFSQVPYIVGCNNTEGYGILGPGGISKGFHTGLSEEDATQILDGYMYMIGAAQKPAEVKRVLINEYTKGLDKEKDPMYWSKLTGSLTSDASFLSKTVKTAELFSETAAPTYMYYMTQDLRYNHDARYNHEEKPKLKSDICKCDHGDDLNFTWGFPLVAGKRLLDVTFTEEETRFSELWMSYIVNFATTGNPNKGPNSVAVEWPQYSKEKKEYLDANASPFVSKDLMPNLIKLWNVTVPGILGTPASVTVM